MVNRLNFHKNAFLISILLINCNLISQVSPSTSPPVNFSGTYSSGSQNNVAPNAILNTVNVSNGAAYDMKAGYSIGILPGSSAANFSSGSFAAYIQQSPIEVVSYHPAGFNNIPLYDKFELGIKLPADLTNSINNFFGSNNKLTYNSTLDLPCPNGYGNDFKDANGINPYDPDKISVEATFSFPGKQSQTVYGFYYREYSYNTNPPPANPTYLTVDWIENTNLQYHWRVRFAPRYIGTYTVTWKITTSYGTVINYQDNIGQTFSTITSNNPGFVKLGVNKKFLVTQPDPSQPQKTILAVGINEQTPVDDKPVTTSDDPTQDIPFDDCPSYGCIGVNFAYPSRFIRHRERIKTRIAQQGANLVRVYNMFHAYAIEYEKANVYDASPTKPIVPDVLQIPTQTGTQRTYYYGTNYKGVNRQAIMWEFDQLLDMAKARTDAGDPFYIQWVLDDTGNGYSIADGGWENRNPYYKIIFNPKNPASIAQFFTDANAKAAYKKRLRYTIARYGYSTNIIALELFNEFQHLKDQMGGSFALDNIFKPWLSEMLDYIKDPSGLNHGDHLLTVSYEYDWGLGGDNVGDLLKLDFMSGHPYIFHTDNTFGFVSSRTNQSVARYGKPYQAGELGLQPEWGHFNLNTTYSNRMFPEYMAPTFHTLLWSTAFTGGLTVGMEMWSGALSIDPDNSNPNPYDNVSNPTGAYPRKYACGNGLTQHFKPLKAFVKDIEFDAGKYVPRHYTTTDDKLEIYYLIDNLGSNNADHVIGYVRNRTFWWKNFSNSNSGAPFYDSNLTNDYNSLYSSPNTPSVSLPSGQPVISGYLGSILIPELKSNTQYSIEWYDTYSDPPALISTPTALWTNVSGNFLNLNPPNFTGCFRQEYGFKIKPIGEARLMLNSPNQISATEENIKFSEDMADINIYPNPSNAVFNIKYNDDLKILSVNIIDNMGRIIKTINNKPTSIDLSNYSRGLYQVQFQTEKTIITKKITLSY
ncbi:MAG: T9SS type A sorting domain-containing protein [Bacteroidetes bacterium]|nr:T9SS type A sorting domain-containing protein [Bacteroidota bacterium]